MAIGPKKRFQVLNRDGFECKYCGLKGGNGVQLQVDHIIPKSNGGDDSIDNLITSCFECNIGKGKNNIVEKNENNLHKTKIADRIDYIKKQFTDEWNSNSLGVIDKNTYILLMHYIEKSILSELDEIISIDAWEEKVDKEDKKLLFLNGGDYCSSVLSQIDGKYTVGLEDGTVGMIVFDDTAWNPKWKYVDNYNYRLNYCLTKEMKEEPEYNQRLLMKYSYFYNEIEYV